MAPGSQQPPPPPRSGSAPALRQQPLPAREVPPSSAPTAVSGAGGATSSAAAPKAVGGRRHRRVRRRLQEDEEEEEEEEGFGRAGSKLRAFMAAPFTMTMHMVAEKRGPEFGRKIPLQVPGVHGKYKDLGDFVQHHRDNQGRLARGEAPPEPEEPEKEEPELPPVEEEVDEEAQKIFEDGISDLHKAALENDAHRVRLLLSGPDPRRILPSPDLSLAEDDSMATPALKAAKYGCAASCAALLDGRADPLVRDNSPRFFSDAIWPLEKKPDFYGTVEPKDIRDDGALPGRTVIYWLRLKGKFDEVVSRLFPMTRVALVRSIAAGLQEHYGEPALVAAARDGNADLAALLLTHTAAGLPPLVVPPSGGASTFYSTAPSGWGGSGWGGGGVGTTAYGSTMRGAAGSTLRSTGSSWAPATLSTNTERSRGLLMACCQKEWRTALIIIGAGVPSAHMGQAKDRLGRTSLHIAASLGSTEVVKALVKAGHPLRLTSYRGRQPIHEACYAGHAGCATALLDGRADPMAVTEEDVPGRPGLPGRRESKRGMTAHEIAAARGNDRICTLLAQHRGGSTAAASAPAGAGRQLGLGRHASEPVLAC